MSDVQGPAYLDLINAIAHKRLDCPKLVEDDPNATGESIGGPIGGVEWCPVCGDDPFVPSVEGERT